MEAQQPPWQRLQALFLCRGVLTGITWSTVCVGDACSLFKGILLIKFYKILGEMWSARVFLTPKV